MCLYLLLGIFGLLGILRLLGLLRPQLQESLPLLLLSLPLLLCLSLGKTEGRVGCLLGDEKILTRGQKQLIFASRVCRFASQELKTKRGVDHLWLLGYCCRSGRGRLEPWIVLCFKGAPQNSLLPVCKETTTKKQLEKYDVRHSLSSMNWTCNYIGRLAFFHQVLTSNIPSIFGPSRSSLGVAWTESSPFEWVSPERVFSHWEFCDFGLP